MQLQHAGAGLLPRWSFLFRYSTFSTSSRSTSCARVISCLTPFDASEEGERENKGGCYISIRRISYVGNAIQHTVCAYMILLIMLEEKWRSSSSSSPLTSCLFLSYQLWLMEPRDLWAAIQGSSGPWWPRGGSCHQQSGPRAPDCGFCWAEVG